MTFRLWAGEVINLRLIKPWGYEDLIFVGPRYAFKSLFMLEGHACSLQFHEEKHETVYVVSGELLFEVGDSVETLEAHRLRPGDSWVIEPLTIHRMTAVRDSLYFEASTPQLEDVVRLADNYGRMRT